MKCWIVLATLEKPFGKMLASATNKISKAPDMRKTGGLVWVFR